MMILAAVGYTILLGTVVIDDGSADSCYAVKCWLDSVEPGSRVVAASNQTLITKMEWPEVSRAYGWLKGSGDPVSLS